MDATATPATSAETGSTALTASSPSPTPPAVPPVTATPEAPPAAPPAAPKADGAAPGAELTLKLPDGFTAADVVESAKPIFKELGLDSTKAQRVVDHFVQAAVTAEKAQREALEKEHHEWTQALRADKEIGGTAFEANVETARKAVVKFGSPELREFLNKTGLGDHPELVKAFHRIGKALAEDSVALPTAGGNAPATGDSDAFHRALYPNTPQLFRKG